MNFLSGIAIAYYWIEVPYLVRLEHPSPNFPNLTGSKFLKAMFGRGKPENRFDAIVIGSGTRIEAWQPMNYANGN